MNNFYKIMQGRIPKLLLIPVIWALAVQTSYAQTNVAPFADAFATPTTGMAPLTVTFDGSGSYDPDGTIVDYQWNSSDGQTTSGVEANLTFRAAGAYDIDLVVVDDFGSVNINTAQQTIKVTLAADSKPPIAKFTATPTTGTAPLTVKLDASESSDQDGKIVEYQWNSSDGQTASGRDATMTFDSVGTYQISLVVKDNNGLISTNSAQQTISVTAKASLQPPVAKFTATPTTGTAPLTVKLDASESSDQDGEIVEYQWKSTDGQTASGRNATMTFNSVGTYKISLVVKDNDGLISTNTAQHTINVTAKPSPQPPVAKFTATPTSGTAPLTVQLDASDSSDPDGKIVEYQWKSSDGQTACGRNVTMTFDSVGTYDISLAVKDKDELTSSITLPVVVHKSVCATPPFNMVAWWPLDENYGTTSNDIVGSNNGTHIGSPVPTSGKVNGALDFGSFGSPLSYVEVPDSPSLNFGTGDLSIDAWFNNGIGPIVSKLSNSGIGYELRSDIIMSTDLPSGTRALILTVVGSEGGLSYYDCGEVPPAPWSHVAAVIDRGTNTAKCYVNGVLSDTITDSIMGSTATAGDSLFIGYNTINSDRYAGIIDEVELFNRALTESEIQDIYNAGAAGKCKDFILMPWDRRPCIGENTVDVAATVCNNSTVPQTYELSSVLPSSYHSQCNFIPTPPIINYNVSPTQITVLPRQCNTFTVQIDVPAGLTASDTACYTATVNNVTAGHNLSNEGSILGPTEWCVVGPPDMAFQTLDLSEPTSVTLNVTNTGDTAKTLDYTLIPVRSDMDESREASLSINGQEPGIGVSDKLFLNPGETGQITFTAALTQRDPFSVAEAILMTDVDGEGIQEPLYSTAFLYRIVDSDEHDDDQLSQILFDGLKNAYDIGDTLTITVAESSGTSRSERVDLWVGAQMPTGELVYITSSPSEPFSLEPLPFKTSLNPSETVHSVFEFQVPSGMEGKYRLYALYAQEGSNPLVADTTVWQSNLITFPIWLAQCLPATYTQSSGLLHFPTVKVAGEPVQVFEANLQLDSLPRVFKFIDATPLPDNAATRAECPIFEPSTGQLHVPAAITTEGSQTIELELQLESPTSLRFNIINVTPSNLSTLF